MVGTVLNVTLSLTLTDYHTENSPLRASLQISLNNSQTMHNAKVDEHLSQVIRHRVYGTYSQVEPSRSTDGQTH